MITVDDVVEAAERIGGVIHRTPLVRANALSTLVGRPVILKPEYRQRTGSFKIRGAYNHIACLPPGRAVVAASAGNHAQGVALAAALTDRRAVIFMPRGAALPKVEATQGYGAEVQLIGVSVHDAIDAARAHAQESGASFVPPFDDPLVVAGQGTVGLEIDEELKEDATIVVSIGGGGLISGIATALKARRPNCKVIGVEAERAVAMKAAVEAGEPVLVDLLPTMADGIAARRVSHLTLEHVQRYVDDIVTVTEDELSRALLALLERSKGLVEPAGAATFAAVLAGKIPGNGPVVSVLSGGNIDPVVLMNLIEHGLTATGRYLRVRVILNDRPGVLAELAALVSDLGLNIIDVEHHRAGTQLAINEVEVTLTVETRGWEHSSQVVDALVERGFRAHAAE